MGTTVEQTLTPASNWVNVVSASTAGTIQNIGSRSLRVQEAAGDPGVDALGGHILLPGVSLQFSLRASSKLWIRAFDINGRIAITED